MKKACIGVLAILFLLTGLAGCDDAESTDLEKALIAERIKALEDAINDNDYPAFKDCMHTGTDQFDSYTEEAFNDMFSGITYQFTNRYVDINSYVAVVVCAAVINGNEENSQDTRFDVRAEGAGWYIFKWIEDGDTLFDRYVTFPE